MIQARKAALVGGLIAIPALVPVGRSLAEEGLRATVTVGQRIESISESGFVTPQDDGTRSLTTLDFGLTTETSNQSLALQLGAGLAYEFSGAGSNGNSVEDPTGSLRYAIENRGSLLTFNATYRRTDLGTSNLFFDEILQEEITVDEGTRTTASARTGLTVGRDGPVTLSLNHLYARTSYTDTTLANLSDNTTQAINGRVDFRISPVLQTFVFANWRETEQELSTATDRTTQSIGFGSTIDLDPATSLTAQISYDESESIRVGGVTRTDGLGYALRLTRAVSNGSYNINLSRTETIVGGRQQLTVGRSLDLPRGALSLALGATRTEGLSTEPLVNLGLNYALAARSQININLSQSTAIDNSDAETLRTRLGVNYTHEINTLSSISAGLQLADSNVLTPGGVDQSSVSANLTYRRAVGGDWDLISGYRYTSNRRDDRANRNTSAVFFGIERTFDFRP